MKLCFVDIYIILVVSMTTTCITIVRLQNTSDYVVMVVMVTKFTVKGSNMLEMLLYY